MQMAKRWFVAGLIAAVAGPAAAARADLPGELLTGLNLLDHQFSLQKNYLGKGWDFDSTAYYAGQTYRFGLADLTLGATTPAAMRISAGYTLRGLPSARFSMVTSGPLSYTLKANYGIQDLTAVGTMLIDVDTTINALGFYDMTFQLSNRGTFQTEGFAGADDGTVDFDAGPIVVSGNVFADLLAALTQPLFSAAGTENPFAKFSQKAVRGLPEIDYANLDLGNLSSEDAGKLIANTIVSGLLGQEPSADLFGSLLAPQDLVADATATTRYGPEVPEPGTLVLLTLGLAACRRRA